MSMPNNPSIKPKRVLVLALSGIGNLLMQLPTIRGLKEQYPEAEITMWVAPRGTRALAEIEPAVYRVIEEPIAGSPLTQISRAMSFARQRFDTTIMLSPGQQWKGAAYMFLAGSKYRVAHTYPFRGNQHSSFLLTHAIDEQDNLHDIEQNLNLLKPFNVDLYKLPAATHLSASAAFRQRRLQASVQEDLSSRTAHRRADPHRTSYKLNIPPTNQQKAEALLKQLPPERKLIGFHMGSAPNFPWKRWPADRFITVAKALIAKHSTHILLFGGPDEEALKQQVKQQLGDNATIISADLLTTAAVTKQCSLFLSNDSGLMHLAAAVGATTFGLFGPTDEKKTGPRGIDSRVIRSPGTSPTYDTEKNYDLGTTPHQDMLAITPQLVLTEVTRKL